MKTKEIEIDQDDARFLVETIQDVLIDSECTYESALAASLTIASLASIHIGMGKDIFLRNCENFYYKGKDEISKGLQ